MKHIYITLITITILLFSNNLIIAQADCNNGGFEYGNLFYWDAAMGKNNSLGNVNFNNLTYGVNSNNHEIVSPGSDPDIAALNMVDEGNNALRLGDDKSDKDAALMKYTFTVTHDNKDFSFRYAMVMEDPGHTSRKQPYFSYMIYEGSSWTDWKGSWGWFNNTIIQEKKFVADKNNKYFNTQGDLVWKNWTTECVDLSGYVGKEITILFMTADCTKGGHYGYAYIDGLCSDNDAVAKLSLPDKSCAGVPLLADATNSYNEQDHFWSVQESDRYWGRYGTEYTQWFKAEQAGVKDIEAFIRSKGGQLKCNTYYRVKVAVSNECTPWSEMTKLVYITCPEVNAGEDVCCKAGVQLEIGGSKSGNYKFEWSPKDGLNTPNEARTLVDCDKLGKEDPMRFTLTATDDEGCTATDEVLVYRSQPTVSIVQDGGCCGMTLTAEGSNYTSLVWSTGETTQTIMVKEAGTYSVKVTNACGTAEETIIVKNSYDRYYADLDDRNVYQFYSNGSNVNSDYEFQIFNVENPQPSYGQYFATEYLLIIFDRWGDEYHRVQGHIKDCDGFGNPAIVWDGKINGEKVPSQVYNARLYMKNCKFNEWVPVEVTYCSKQEWICTDYDCKFSLFTWTCGKFKKEYCAYGYPGCVEEKSAMVFPITIQF